MSVGPDPRFAGVGRLYRDPAAALARLRQARVLVVGIGGVGSWVVEALARSGVGCLILADLDDICRSNLNRQLHALDDNVGALKVEAMAERVRGIVPECRVIAEACFFSEATTDRLLRPELSAVVDAIDALGNKCRLLPACRERGLPVFTCGGAGGRVDPARLAVADLSATTQDPLAAQVRRRLRRQHGFPTDAGLSFGIPCVFSTEPVRVPTGVSGKAAADGLGGVDDADAPSELGTGEVTPAFSFSASGRGLNCDFGLGNAAFVTGAMGLHLAALVVNFLAERPGKANA